MTTTAIRSDQAYNALFRVLDRNEIHYEIDNCYHIRCDIRGQERDISLFFTIDSGKMLATLYAPLPLFIPGDQITELSVALCLINHTLSDGLFCYDITGGLLYFKMTASFYNSRPDDSVYEYMLSVAAETIDEYVPKLSLTLLN